MVPAILAMAAIGGDGLVHQLLMIFLVALASLVVYAMGVWAIRSFAAPPFARTAWDGLFILIGGIAVINFLLGLAGHPFIVW